MFEHDAKPLWGIYREQNERNERAGHPELLYGLFTTREAADQAVLRLRKLYAGRPGKLWVGRNSLYSGGYQDGFYEYDPAEYRRKIKRSRRPNRHQGFTPKDPEPYRP